MNAIPESIARLKAHFGKVVVRPPVDRRNIAALRSRFGIIPEELEEFYAYCNGVTVGLRDSMVGHLLPLETSLKFTPIASDCEPANRFFPIRSDGCGDYDCVVLASGTAEGAVVFWDHEVYDGPAYLLAGSFRTYLAMWTDHIVNRYLPNGEEDERYIAPHLDRWPWIGKPEKQHPWPFDESWIKARDARAAEILDDPSTRVWLLRQGE